jgi:hypothetical protein
MHPERSHRRALTDLPVNTQTMPPKITKSKGGTASLKRGVDQVEGVDLPPPARRMRVIQQTGHHQESQTAMQSPKKTVCFFLLGFNQADLWL